MTSLVNNLGGTAGFGEFSLARNDDGSTAFINLQSIFGTQGINFFGDNYTGLYLNNNGSVTFNAATSSFTPSAITGSTSNPVIAAYWADIDTRGGAAAPTPGGTSTGTNLLWYDLDSTTHTFTATWDDVGYYNGQTNKLNAFQLSLHQINAQGDFDITFRYENVDWTTGGASGGSNGLGGTPARAGYSAGNGVEYFELPQSGNQAALLALESASNVGTPGTFVFQVRNGAPAVAISMGDASVTEGNGPSPGSVTIPVFLTEPSDSTVTVHYTTANGSALAGQDYVAQSGILTFAPGVTQQNIVVAVTGDTDVEGNETFTVTLSDPSEGVSILDGTATGTIVNDDASLSIAATSADKAEGQSGSSSFTFTVTRTGDVSGGASAQWAVTGAAVDGTDFAGGVLPSGVVSFAAGETSKVITIDVAGDTLPEPNEAFSVTLSNPSAGAVVGTASADGVIRDDDASLSIAATSADKAEGQSGNASFTFTVTRAGDVSGAASAAWAVTGAAVDGTDFADGVVPSGVVSFAAGETSKVITIDVAGDTLPEPNEAFSVTLSNPSAGAVVGTASADGVIRDDDGSLSIAATSADKAEGQSGNASFTFTVTRAGDVSGAASAEWVVTGAAVDGADFAGGVVPSGVVSFAAGETSKVITIDVAGDSMVEADEALSVTLSNPSAGAILGTDSADGVIRNDDTSLSIAAASADKAEGQSGNASFTFTVTRAGDVSGAASAAWAVTGAAVDGTDFAGGVVPSGVVSFAAGETSKVITINVAGDSLVEPDEAFSVTLSGPSQGVSILDGTATSTIVNDDGSLSIAAASADKAEGQSGNASFTFTVTRAGDVSGAASAAWAVTGAAVDGTDFAGGVVPSGVVSFAAGETSKVIAIAVAGDTLAEADEAFSVTLSNPSAGAILGTDSANGVIRNDDTSLSIAAASADKAEGDVGATAFTFTVTRSGDTSGPTSVDWAVSGAEVSASDFIPVDGLLSYADIFSYLASLFESISPGFLASANVYSYLASLFESFQGAPVSGDGLPSGSVSFAAGETSKTVTVWALGETAVEGDESFSVTLSNASAGSVIEASSAVGTILNDDDDETTTIEAFGATLLGQVTNQFFLGAGGGNGPSLKYAGADVVADQFGAWTPLGMEQVGSGYEVVWKNGTADQYIVWNVDGDGNWTSQTEVVSGSDMSLQTAELTFQQDFNADGTTGLKTTPIETSGATDLDQVANAFFLHDGAGNGPSLKYAGSDVVAGQFGAWTPLGAETVGDGYQVVWKNGSADQYILWNVDSNGNWKNQSDVVSGSAYALQSLETPFQQNFNADGTTGLKTTPIETSGATDLDQVANAFFLRDGAGNGPSLKYAGSDVVAGQFGAWTPLGAETVGDGYQVVWKYGSTDQYLAWTTDSDGHWTSQTAVVSGSAYALQSLETAFQQDFNADGTTGLQTTPIETLGATQLDQVANEFFLRDGSGNGPSLKYAGADVVAGQFGAWTPLGVEKIGSGYQVVWKYGSADQYIVWNVNSDGHWTSQTGAVSGSEHAFQSLETAFKQDFNADGTTGLKTTPIETSGATQLDQVANEFFLRDGGGNGPSLKYAGTDVVADQFGAWTPIGGEKTADGYEVAWQNGTADQYVIWNLDDHGHYSSMTDVLSGASPAVETLEPTFHQDLNRDGIIG